MRTKHVIVEAYDPKWNKDFEKIASELSKILGAAAIAIEHVGSTSVPGLSAKPIIDLDVVVQNDNLPHVISILEEHGYIHEGDLGITGREAFAYTQKEHLMLHHLYVCPQNSPELYRHLTFRNWLRSHPEDVAAYSRIKEEGARQYPLDIDAYCEYKAPVITEIYAKCGLL